MVTYLKILIQWEILTARDSIQEVDHIRNGQSKHQMLVQMGLGVSLLILVQARLFTAMNTTILLSKSTLADENDKNWKKVVVDFSQINTPDNLYDEFSKKIGFPEFFGRNIHVLIDCLFNLRYPEA